MTDIFAILIFAIVVIVVWVVASYIRLVASREKVREVWSSMDIQLKRRSNVVENLLNTVKGYVKHEKDALAAVTEMRTRTISAADAGAAERETAEGELSTALIRLFAVAEATLSSKPMAHSSNSSAPSRPLKLKFRQPIGTTMAASAD